MIEELGKYETTYYNFKKDKKEYFKMKKKEEQQIRLLGIR